MPVKTCSHYFFQHWVPPYAFCNSVPLWKKVADVALICFDLKTGLFCPAFSPWRKALSVVFLLGRQIVLNIALYVLEGVARKIHRWLFPPFDKQLISITSENLTNKVHDAFPKLNATSSWAIQNYFNQAVISLLHHGSSLADPNVQFEAFNLLQIYFLFACQDIEGVSTKLNSDERKPIVTNRDVEIAMDFAEFYHAFYQGAAVAKEGLEWTLKTGKEKQEAHRAQFHNPEKKLHHDANRLYNFVCDLTDQLIEEFPHAKSLFTKTLLNKNTNPAGYPNPPISVRFKIPQVKLTDDSFVTDELKKLKTSESHLYTQLEKEQNWEDKQATLAAGEMVATSANIALHLLNQVEALAKVHSLTKEQVAAFVMDKTKCCIFPYLIRMARSYHAFCQSAHFEKTIENGKTFATFTTPVQVIDVGPAREAYEKVIDRLNELLPPEHVLCKAPRFQKQTTAPLGGWTKLEWELQPLSNTV
jgi:hypothetical protein